MRQLLYTIESKTSIAILLMIFLMSSCIKERSDYLEGRSSEFTIDREGLTRSYYLYLPSQEQQTTPMPVVFVLHGGGGTAKGMSALIKGRFDDLADRDGFMIVYPQGHDKAWNDGRTDDLSEAHRLQLDDVGFISEIVDIVDASFNIDRKRIFTSGISNGGFMSSKLLCDRADLFRGGAIVTATISKEYFPQCHPSNPVGVLVMNGTDDPLVPYDGGQISIIGQARGEIISTDDYIKFWENINGCSTSDIIENTIDNENDDTSVELKAYTSCSTGGALSLYRIVGGGHNWPGGIRYAGERLIGLTSEEINASDEIWEFFRSLD